MNAARSKVVFSILLILLIALASLAWLFLGQASSLQSQNDSLQNQIRELQNTNSELQQQAKQLQTDMTIMQNQTFMIQAQNAILENQTIVLNKENNRLTEENAYLQSQIFALGNKTSLLQTQINEVKEISNSTKYNSIEIVNFSHAPIPSSYVWGWSIWDFTVAIQNNGSDNVTGLILDINLSLSDGQVNHYSAPIDLIEAGEIKNISGAVGGPGISINLMGLRQSWLVSLKAPVDFTVFSWTYGP